MDAISSSKAAFLAMVMGGSAVVCSCGDQASEIEALQNRVAELEARLEGSPGEQGDRETILSSQVNELTHRTEELEKTVGPRMEAVASALEEQNKRLDRFGRGFGEIQEMVKSGQTWAAFGLGYEGHTVAKTRHGPFLVELLGQEPEPDGYRLSLRIGNPTGLMVHQFRIFGNYGPPPPKLAEAGSYEQFVSAYDSWESTLKDFNQTFSATLPPDDWSRVEISLPKAKLADLQFVRFRMAVERASLVPADGETLYSQIGVDYEGATFLQTKQGTFPMTIERAVPTDGGTDLKVLIGNPLGMTVTSSRLTGFYGPKPPVAEDFPKDYGQQLAAWENSLTPFEFTIPKALSPFHWNEVTIKLDEKDRSQLAYMRVRLEVQNILLRNPQ